MINHCFVHMFTLHCNTFYIVFFLYCHLMQQRVHDYTCWVTDPWTSEDKDSRWETHHPLLPTVYPCEEHVMYVRVPACGQSQYTPKSIRITVTWPCILPDRIMAIFWLVTGSGGFHSEENHFGLSLTHPIPGVSGIWRIKGVKRRLS